MQFSAQSLLTNSQSHHNHSHLWFYSAHIHVDPLKPPIFALPHSRRHERTCLHFSTQRNRTLSPFKTLKYPVRVFESGGAVRDEGFERFNFDAVLSIVEVLCLAPSAVVSIGCAVNWGFLSSQKWFQVSLVNNRVFVWQSVLLAVAVVVGALIRRRQWSRVCRDSKKESGLSVVNLVERVEKLEEDLRSSVSIIRVLSRQLEKLGIRFRVTRKALKQPIDETAVLAQKNSEATRALAIQEDILEKELGEIQKVLLAMQEQQQKQLELIVAFGRAGKLREVMPAGQDMYGQSKSDPGNEGPKQKQTITTQDQTTAAHKGSTNDRP